MAHWSRIITEDDAPEWTTVRHADGTISEIKVGVSSDEVHVSIQRADGATVLIHDEGD